MSQQQQNQGPKDQPVHRITEARESHTNERDTRIRKYTISMSIRMVCFILAFFVEGWMRWALLAAAVVLPYIAVVLANGGADLTKREPPAEFYAKPDPQALEDHPETISDPPADVIIIDGTLADTETDPESDQSAPTTATNEGR